MTLKFSPALAATLNTAVSKTAWCNAIISALGPARVLRMKRDPNPAAIDPWTTGIEFINVGLTGTMLSQGGNIVNFGLTSGYTIHTAVSLTTGSSVLRIQDSGGTNWIQGTLGAIGSGSDFELSADTTALSGIGFTPACSVLAPTLLPSGTGPTAPTLVSTSPNLIELEDWTSGSAVVVGSLTFNNRTSDFVFQDGEMAAEIGDVGIYQSTQSITFGNFEFGATLFASNKVNTVSGINPLYQVLVGCKPLASTGWTTYPAMDTYSRTVNTTYPEPFKINIKDSLGNILHTYQMQDGLPINSPLLSQTWDQPAGEPLVNNYGSVTLRPDFNCGMMLPWSSTETRISTNASKIYPGVIAEVIRPSGQGKQGASVLSAIPISTQSFYSGLSINSQNHGLAMPQWPMVTDFNYGDVPPVSITDPLTDPYLFDISVYRAWAGKPVRMTGWGYEPGSISGHDWYTGPGGPRFDRASVPSVMATLAADPNYIRLQGNVPIRTWAEHWGLAYFNHSMHYLTDVKTFETLPPAEMESGVWRYANSYYSGGRAPPDTSTAIDLLAILSGSGRTTANQDSSGRLVWGGWAADSLHSYAAPGWWTLMLNSPMHAYSAKMAYNKEWMCSLGSAPPTTNSDSFFLVREQAFRYLHLTTMWKLASSHPVGLNRSYVESRWQTELETLYDTVYVPTFVNNVNSVYNNSVRNLGVAGGVSGSGPTAFISSGGGDLAFYMGHVMCLMKQSGAWSAMRQKSAKCAVALEMMINCFDKASIDYILDTTGRDEANGGYPVLSPEGAVTAADVPANWAAVNTMQNASWPIDTTGTAGNWRVWSDWISAYAPGSGVPLVFGGGQSEPYVAQHLKAQYAFIRRDYFPEYPNARLPAACAKYQTYYDTITSRVDSQFAATGASKAVTDKDWHYRYAALGVIKPPSSLGPV